MPDESHNSRMPVDDAQRYVSADYGLNRHIESHPRVKYDNTILSHHGGDYSPTQVALSSYESVHQVMMSYQLNSPTGSMVPQQKASHSYPLQSAGQIGVLAKSRHDLQQWS